MTENEQRDARIDEIKRILVERALWEDHWAKYRAGRPQNSPQEPV